MEPEFWHERWRDGRIGFHEAEGNALLQAHLPALEPAQGARVFLPLSGKSRDIGWLLARGYRVVAAELSEVAIAALFDDLGVTPKVTPLGAVSHWAAPGLDVFVGDVFDLDATLLGPVDATLDRAALVALPEGMRARYAAHVTAITGRAPILIVTFEYAAGAINGPPFSLDMEALQGLFGTNYDLQELETRDVSFGSGAPATERAVILRAL